MTVAELREKRANLWKGMESFLDSRRDGNGILSAEDDAAYSKMENDMDALNKEIKRLERKDAFEAELNKPVASPITDKPMKAKESEEKPGRASDTYAG